MKKLDGVVREILQVLREAGNDRTDSKKNLSDIKFRNSEDWPAVGV